MPKLENVTKASDAYSDKAWPVGPVTDFSIVGPSALSSMKKSSAGNVEEPTKNTFLLTGPSLEKLKEKCCPNQAHWKSSPESTYQNPERFFFYHKNCNDGLMSAVMAFLKYGNHYSDAPSDLARYPQKDSDNKCHYIPIYPDQAIDEEILAKFNNDTRVYFLDVLAASESVKRMHCRVRLIDHHKTNIVRFRKLAESHGNLDDCADYLSNIAGSMLCYNRFVAGSSPHLKEAKKWAQLVSARDTMNFSGIREEKEARFAYIYLNTMPKSIAQWVSVVLDRPFRDVYNKSESAVKFYEHQIKDAMKDTLKFKFCWYDIVLVNVSQVFFSDAAWVAPDGLYMNAAFRKKGVQIQLRGKGAQNIARELGGDGHPKAAGAFITHERFMEVVYG